MFYLDNLKKNISLAPYTTFKIGGPATYFYEAKNSQDLIKAVKAAKKAKIPYFILGGGSNILVSDKGFDGLVIKIQNTKYEIRDTKIMAEAGVLLSELVNESVNVGLTGLEWAAGIPATVGGAVRGNAGAFGASMADIVSKVKILRDDSLFTVYCSSKDFSYRSSVFKENNDIILEVELKLNKGDKQVSKELIKKHLAYRKKHQPKYPSAGCIFKNLPEQSAGHLIERSGLNGRKMGRAQIFEKHGNFIINLGGAKASEVKKLIDLGKEKVKEKFGVELKEEIEYLGDF